MRSSDSFVVAVVEDGLSRSKKRSSLKDITDSKLAKLGFDFLSEDNQKDLQKTLAPRTLSVPPTGHRTEGIIILGMERSP